MPGGTYGVAESLREGGTVGEVEREARTVGEVEREAWSGEGRFGRSRESRDVSEFR